LSANSPELAVILARVLSPQSVDWISRALSAPLSLPCKIAFPAGRDLSWWRLGSNAGSVGWKASISRCLDHSAGKSVRRAMPMPHGSRPSMAALTRSGARKASEIVMLTFRRLHRSRFAMRSVVSDASFVSSLSHRRPRAMAATSVARVWERIGKELPIRSPRRRGQARFAE